MQSDVKMHTIKLKEGFDKEVNKFAKQAAAETPPRKLISVFVYGTDLVLVTELA